MFKVQLETTIANENLVLFMAKNLFFSHMGYVKVVKNMILLIYARFSLVFPSFLDCCFDSVVLGRVRSFLVFFFWIRICPTTNSVRTSLKYVLWLPDIFEECDHLIIKALQWVYKIIVIYVFAFSSYCCLWNDLDVLKKMLSFIIEILYS